VQVAGTCGGEITRSRLRLSQGQPPAGTAARGDLYLNLRLEEPSDLEARWRPVRAELPLSLDEPPSAARCRVATPDG